MVKELSDPLHPSHKSTTMPEQDYLTERSSAVHWTDAFLRRCPSRGTAPAVVSNSVCSYGTVGNVIYFHQKYFIYFHS